MVWNMKILSISYYLSFIWDAFTTSGYFIVNIWCECDEFSELLGGLLLRTTVP